MEGELKEQGETPIGEKTHKLPCHHGRNQERRIILRKKEKKLCSKNIIIHGVAKSSSVSKDDRVKSGDVYRTNFTAALKVRCTIKRESKKGLLIPKWPIKVVIISEEQRNKILSNLRNLKNIPKYKTISVTVDYTIIGSQMIKDWLDRAKERNKNEPPNSKLVWRVQCDPKSGLQLLKPTQVTDCNKACKKIQENQE